MDFEGKGFFEPAMKIRDKSGAPLFRLGLFTSLRSVPTGTVPLGTVGLLVPLYHFGIFFGIF